MFSFGNLLQEVKFGKRNVCGQTPVFFIILSNMTYLSTSIFFFFEMKSTCYGVDVYFAYMYLELRCQEVTVVLLNTKIFLIFKCVTVNII